MAAIFVVIGGVNETVPLPVEGCPLIREEKVMAGDCPQHLKTESRLFVDAKSSVESAQVVVLVDKAVRGAQKSDERILRTNVVLHSQDGNMRILIEQASESGLLLSHAREVGRRGVRTAENKGRIGSDESSIFLGQIPGSIIAGQHQSKSVAVNLAGELERHVRINDRSRVHRDDLALKDVD